MPKRSKPKAEAKEPPSNLRPWPADKVERWGLDRIKEYPKNARSHSPQQIAQLSESMSRFGVTTPVLVDEDGVLLYGHGRTRAAALLGYTELPVSIARGWSEDEKKAYRLVDNQLGLTSTWEMPLLKSELGELRLADFDLPLLGFSEAQLRGWGIPIGSDNGQDADAILDPPKKPVVRIGDLWLLGEHRLLCGDSTKAEDVAQVMDGASALLMATDPPYGVAYDNAQRPNPGVAKPRVAKPRVANDELVDGPAMQAFLEAMLRAALPHMDKHAAFYFWHPMLTQGTYVAAAAAAGILIHRQIIWVKPVLLLGRGDYHWRHELCFYGWQKGNRPPFYGARNQDTIWEVASVTHKERKEMNHATPKPVALWDKPIVNHTKSGDIIYEPFSGSGTQIVAAEQMGRKCYAIELDPANTQVAIERWQNFTGKLAALNGKTLEQVAKARRVGRPKEKGATEIAPSEEAAPASA